MIHSENIQYLKKYLLPQSVLKSENIKQYGKSTDLPSEKRQIVGC